MGKTNKITVQGVDINVESHDNNDYICLTDMIKAKEGDFFVSDWLRNRNTLEYLAAWESMNNPSFNYGEFAVIANSAGLNSYKISVKEWCEKTNSIGINAKTGRYGGRSFRNSPEWLLVFLRNSYIAWYSIEWINKHRNRCN